METQNETTGQCPVAPDAANPPMQFTTYLHFKDSCSEAFDFYARVFGGTIEMKMSFGESPAADQIGPDAANLIMHAQLRVGNALLMGSDSPPQCPGNAPMGGFSVAVFPAMGSEGDRWFDQLSDGGEVRLPMQQTFWSPRFGMCVDKFGVAWILNCQAA